MTTEQQTIIIRIGECNSLSYPYLVDMLSSNLISKCWMKNESMEFFWRLKLAINSLPFSYHATETRRRRKRDNIVKDIIIMKPKKIGMTIRSWSSNQMQRMRFRWVEIWIWRGLMALLIKYDDVIALEINIFIE